MVMLYHENDEDPAMRPKPIDPEQRENLFAPISESDTFLRLGNELKLFLLKVASLRWVNVQFLPSRKATYEAESGTQKPVTGDRKQLQIVSKVPNGQFLPPKRQYSLQSSTLDRDRRYHLGVILKYVFAYRPSSSAQRSVC